jgi:hypothetical protein
MVKKLLIVGLIVAAVVLGLWRLGLIDEGRLKGKATELKDSAEKSVKRAGEDAKKSAREAVDEKLR